MATAGYLPGHHPSDPPALLRQGRCRILGCMHTCLPPTLVPPRDLSGQQEGPREHREWHAPGPTSKSLSRAGVVQILSMSTSKSAPGLPVFNDVDFQIAFARRRGANFVDILGNRSLATPVFRTYLCELSKRQNYGKTQHFAQFLPAKTSLLSNIDAARATGNFQYSRKLELLNFLWQSHQFPNLTHLHDKKTHMTL